MSYPSGFNGSYSPRRERVAFASWPAGIGFNGIFEQMEDHRVWPIVSAWLHGKVCSRFIAACGIAVSLIVLVMDELCKASQSQCKLYSIWHIDLACGTRLGHIWETQKYLLYGLFWVDVGSIIPTILYILYAKSLSAKPSHNGSRLSSGGLNKPLRSLWGRWWGKNSSCSPLRRDTIGDVLKLCLRVGEWRCSPVLSN